MSRISRLLLKCMIPALCIVTGCSRSPAETYDRDKIFKQEFKLKEGDQIAESGNYAEALTIYEMAMGPDYINHEMDKAGPLFKKARALRELKRYDEALAVMQEFRKLNNVQEPTELEREIEALKAYADTGGDGAVRRNIKWVVETYEDILPPAKWVFHSPTYISKILRLYDTIGDLDAGIAYINQVLAFFRTGKAGDPNPGEVDAEFIKIREAFEQDKRDGTKGRATKAIIQSDYFPW